MLTPTKSSIWFDKLRTAWSNKDMGSIKILFANSIKYFEEKDSVPMTSWNEIQKVWEEIKDQEIVKLQNFNEGGDDSGGVSRFDLVYEDSTGKRSSYICRLEVQLDNEGRAVEFSQDCTEVMKI